MEGPLIVKPGAVDLASAADPSFELLVRYADPVVVGVRGDVDALTAPALGALIDALRDAGHRQVVIDVAALGFFGAAGAGVIAAASTRSRRDGGTVAIRSPSPMVRKVLGITGMLALIEEGSASRLSFPVQKMLSDAPGAATAVPEVAAVIASTPGVSLRPATRDVADAALHLVTAIAAEVLNGADGVSITLRRHSTLSTIGASDETIAEMDRDQYATGEGPCLSATSEGLAFHVESAVDEIRWPRFTPRAIEAGIASILSTPLIVAGLPIGALNIYSNTAQAFGSAEHELAALFAKEASAVLVAAGAGETDEDGAARLLDALRSREVIAQAEGAIMSQQGTSATAASADLRRSARRQTLTVRALAAATVEATSRTDPAGRARR